MGHAPYVSGEIPSLRTSYAETPITSTSLIEDGSVLPDPLPGVEPVRRVGRFHGEVSRGDVSGAHQASLPGVVIRRVTEPQMSRG